MGHRALVAYERSDGQYTLHYSHWVAKNLQPKHRIAASSPFGGTDADTEWAQTLLADLRDAGDVGGSLAGDRRRTTLVDPTPIASGWSREEIVADHLDYRTHEAYFEVATDFSVTAYRTFWFGLQFDSEAIDDGATIGNGALATVPWHDGEPVGDGFLRGQFAALKDVVGDLLIDGGLGEADAKLYMLEKLEEWVGEGQELVVSPRVPEPRTKARR